jgi:hypothetical protein
VNNILNPKDLVKKIEYFAKKASRVYSNSPNKAAKVYLKALRLADDFSHGQSFNSKMSKNEFNAYVELSQQFREVEFKIRNNDNSKTGFNKEFKMVYEILNDGQSIIDSIDPNILTLAENLVEEMSKETNLIKKHRNFRKRTDQFFLLYCVVYNDLRNKVLMETSKNRNKDLLNFSLYGGTLTLNNLLGISNFIKNHSFFQLCYLKIKKYENKKSITHEDFLTSGAPVKKAFKTDRTRFKKELIEIASKIDPEVGTLIVWHFDIWFNEIADKGVNDAETSLFYGHDPYIETYEIKYIFDGFYAAHETGHSVFHYFTNDNREYGEHVSNLVINEVCSQVFEMLYMFQKLDNMSNDPESYSHLFYKYLIPNLFLMTVDSSIATEFSISLLSSIPFLDDHQDIKDLNIRITKDHYRGVKFSQDINYDWCQSRALTSPFYSASYLASYPIAFNIARDIHDQGEWGRSSMDYLLNFKGKVTIPGLMEIAKFKTIEENYDRMFVWIIGKMP